MSNIRCVYGLHFSEIAQKFREDLNFEGESLTDLIDLLDDLLAAALAVVDASDGSLLLLDEDTEELVFAVVRGSARNQLTGFRLPPGKGIAGWVAGRYGEDHAHTNQP